MIALTHLSAINISGPDAADFLHNQLSADVKGLAMHQSTWACYCEPKGRVLALLLVESMEDGFYVIMSSSLAQVVTDRMRMYVMRSSVDISILSGISVTGLEQGESTESLPKPIHNIPVPGSHRWLALVKTGTAADTGASHLASWQYSELKQGICWLDTPTSGQFLPQMLGFDKLGAINFKKGCYPGQEIVARTHYLGKVKRHPRFLELSTEPKVEPMGKIHLQGNGMTDEAVLVDSKGNEQLGYGLFVVSRLDPGIEIEGIESTSGSVNSKA